MPKHLVLLGDSIFDNARYVPGGKSVIQHLPDFLGKDWRATLLAVDGSVCSDVSLQLQKLPPDATHLAISTGGNDALVFASALYESSGTGIEHLTRLGLIHTRFEEKYQAMVHAIAGTGRPFAVCTIYDAIPGLQDHDKAGLCIFNDVILRQAFRARAPVIDLRHVCSETTDYSSFSPIEPSESGGKKIARAIARVFSDGPLEGRATPVFCA